MAWIWLAIIGALIAFAYLSLTKSKMKNLPPGPKGFPIFGSLHLLGKFPHRDLHRLSKKYGAIMHIKLGFVHTIVVSSSQAAQLFLKTHDHVFASRPLTESSKYMSYNQKNLVFAQYGSYWRSVRKMCITELLSNFKINSFKSMRERELGLLIDCVREAANNQVAINISSEISSFNVNITCLMVFGKKYEDKEFDERGFKAVMQELMHLVAVPNIGEFIPYVGMLDFQGLTHRMKSTSKVFDEFLERIIDEHLESMSESKNKDFVDVMLELMISGETEYKIDRSSIKAIMLDILVAAVDTSATTIEWGLTELIKHPEVVKKMQEELDQLVGLDRMVKESDLNKLKYLNMVVKEILRLYPPAPLLVPHESLEDCIVDGFHIPNKSRIIVNAWAIGRDPSVWIDPDRFCPERFIDDNQIYMSGTNFKMIPFGYGRRGCPGIQLGLIIVQMVLAQLMHCFDWKLPNGMDPNELDMTEEFGLTCPKAQHLIAIPTCRL